MRRRFIQRRPTTMGPISRSETRDAELFYRDLLGLPDPGRRLRREVNRTAPARRIASLRPSPFEQAGCYGSQPPPWDAEQVDEADDLGLPENDEETRLEFDAEFIEPSSSPNNANAPFAPLLSGAGHWPIITSAPQGRTVSYRTVGGAWIGRPLRSFGADRSSGTRYHIGVDLFGRFGDPVVAIENGRIVRFFPFCCGNNKTSWALLVQHAQVVVNYGEVAPDSLRRNGLSVGSNVTAGQVIGRVGRNPGGSSMVHFETYATGATRSYRWMKGRTRPAQILNPTRLLLQLQEQGLPRPAGGGARTSTPAPSAPVVPSGPSGHSASTQLTTNFTLNEFSSRGTPVPSRYLTNVQRLARNLQVLRDHLGRPIRVSCGYRTAQHNARVGGATHSQHLTASAADIRINGLSLEQVYCAIENLIRQGRMRQGGLGIYSTHVHYDVRGTRARWNRQVPIPDCTAVSIPTAAPDVPKVEASLRTGCDAMTEEGVQNHTDIEYLDENDWYSEEDFIPTEAPPSRRWASCTRYTANDAHWAANNVSIDYRHLNVAGVSQAFSFTAQHLQRLCGLNHFDVTGGQDQVLFGLRGCKIVSGASEGAFVNSVQLSEDLPDHFEYHCVLGVWKRSTNQIAVFKGSTVPNWGYMCRQVQRRGKNANLLPTGRYLYTVGQHRAVAGAFILRAEVVVLRSHNNLIYETTDLWDRCRPGDNIHPGKQPTFAEFSSAGCQTVSGNFINGRHTGSWATFRERAGLDPNNNRDREGAHFVYVLLTGREARLISTGHRAPLHRLRFGSQGPAVRALQMDLKRRGQYTGGVDGGMGPGTTMAYIQWQQARDNGAADGIVTPSVGRTFGFDMIRRQSVPPTPSRSREVSYEYE